MDAAAAKQDLGGTQIVDASHVGNPAFLVAKERTVVVSFDRTR